MTGSLMSTVPSFAFDTDEAWVASDEEAWWITARKWHLRSRRRGRVPRCGGDGGQGRGRARHYFSVILL